MIHFENVDPNNWRIKLKVKDEQKGFVANSTVLLARAYAYRDNRAKAYFIYDDETPIGMALYYDEPEYNCYDLSQFFIDEHFQNKGYGQQALKMLLEEMRNDGKYPQVCLCYVKGNKNAFALFQKAGFKLMDESTDEEANEEIGMELDL